MKQNRLNKGVSAYRGRARSAIMTLAITLVVILALALFSVPKCVADEAGKAGTDSKKAKQVTGSKKQVVPEKLKPAVGQERTVTKSTAVSPKHANSPAATNPVGLSEAQAPFGSPVGTKGNKIKRQLFSSGTARGGTSSKYQLGRAPGDKLNGTVGQVGVGSGSSESFGTSGGFWQAPGEAFLRGDANGDGVINGSDIVYLLNYLYRGGDPPNPIAAGDANCDGVLTGSDIVYLLNYLYRGGPPPSC